MALGQEEEIAVDGVQEKPGVDFLVDLHDPLVLPKPVLQRGSQDLEGCSQPGQLVFLPAWNGDVEAAPGHGDGRFLAGPNTIVRHRFFLTAGRAPGQGGGCPAEGRGNSGSNLDRIPLLYHPGHCGSHPGALASPAMRTAIRWAFPGGMILLMALALQGGVGPETFPDALVSGYAWAVYSGALLLSVFFHRSRVAVATLALMATAWVEAKGSGGFTALYFAGGCLILVLGGASLLKDRGLLSTPGLIQLAGVAVLGLFGGLFLGAAPRDMAAFMAAMPLPGALTIWSGLPQPVFLAVVVAVPTALAAAVYREGPVERGIFWSLIMVILALHLTTEEGGTALFLMAGGLSLGVSVVETSYAMAYKDDLTGLPARRALMRDLEAVGGIYTTAMVDVDHFKKFNDRYGHDVGDQVLRMVAVQIGRVKGGGRAYRYGGEEFTILFSGKTREEALPFAEKVREDVQTATFTLRHWRRPRRKPVDPGAWKFDDAKKPKQLGVTVSIGVADSTGADSEPEAVLKKADRALYRAKKAGRNRVAK